VIQAGFGQGGEVGGGFGEVGQAGEVAPGDTDHLPASETAQPEAEIRNLRDALQGACKPGGVFSRAGGVLQIPAVGQIRQQPRTAGAALGDKVAEREYGCELVVELRIVRQRDAGLPAGLAQPPA
jgi:hypothetical protein